MKIWRTRYRYFTMTRLHSIDPVLRNAAVRAARQFLEAQGFFEVRTNKCVHAGAMEPYIDTFYLKNTHGAHLGFLASSPEMAMKKIFHRELQQNPQARGIYEISPAFRDDPEGKYHLSEFTMAEWYARGMSRDAIVTQAIQLVKHIAAALGNTEFPYLLQKIDLRKILHDEGLPLDTSTAFPYSAMYTERHGKMPHHLNTLDGEIACFNLLFDEVVLPQLRAVPSLVAVEGFPACLAALARVENDTACRTELFFAGLELANAYTEEYDAEKIHYLWASYNEIRRLRGVPEHPIDTELLRVAPTMKGVCGIALGLERVLCLMGNNFGL